MRIEIEGEPKEVEMLLDMFKYTETVTELPVQYAKVSKGKVICILEYDGGKSQWI